MGDAAGRNVVDLPRDRDDLDPEVDARDAEYAFARDVELEARRIRVRDAARVKVAAEQQAEAPPFDDGLLGEVLARPAPPPFRVEQLVPSDAGTLLVASRKTGKTTWELNLADSLLTGRDFLGRFGVRAIDGRVGLLNFEVSGHQLGRWADEAGVDRQRLYLVNLRGRRNPLANDDDRAELTRRVRAHEVETLIVDPFGRAYTGKSQNDPGEVAAWLADLDQWARGECGVVDLVLAAHAGWNGERTRGASALEDWADSMVTLVRDADDDQLRFLKAEGRDVLIDEDRLAYDAATRRLSLAGTGSRRQGARQRHVEELIPAVVDAVRASPKISGYKLQTALREAGATYQRGDEVKAAKLAVERGLLTATKGPRNSTLYAPATAGEHLSPPAETPLPRVDSDPASGPGTYPDLSRPIPAGQVTTYPDLPSIEREVVTDRSDSPPIPPDFQAALDATPDDPPLCTRCGRPLHPVCVDAGQTEHEACPTREPT